MSIEVIVHYLNTHISNIIIKLFLILIPTGLFVFTEDQELMIQSLFWIVVLDTVLGTILAIKLRVFSSIGMGRFVKKIIPYSLVLLTVHLTDLSLSTGDNLLFLTGSYLIFREAVSNLEKGVILNVPIPKKVMSLLDIKIEDIGKAREDWKKRDKR